MIEIFAIISVNILGTRFHSSVHCGTVHNTDLWLSRDFFSDDGPREDGRIVGYLLREVGKPDIRIAPPAINSYALRRQPQRLAA